MATQALYNKWRGQTFEDILGQEHITTTLQNQIKAGRIGHAYLFAGLRGTGKTSTARILAKAVNCVGQTDNPPCNQCHICRSITDGRSLDLIEVDAASNRGIDEIRDLRDKVNFAPSECRFKVYVIDEVHMLTNEAFNALLKTLEEPPAHVIFILCTTEAHRLPETVLSRCQRFDFRRGALPVLMTKLRKICEQEKIAISPDALEFIARRATGSFRDAESLLDQLASYKVDEITLELVQSVLGSVSSSLVLELVSSIVSRDIPAGLRVINEALDNGVEPREFLSEILDHLRGLMLLKVGGAERLVSFGEEALAAMREIASKDLCSLDLLLRATRLFNDAGIGLRTAARPQIPLELAFIEATLQPDRKAVSEVVNVPATAQPPEMAIPAKPQGSDLSASSDQALPSPSASAKQAEPSASVAGTTALRESKSEQIIPGRDESLSPDDAERQPERVMLAQTQKLTLEWVRGNWRQALLRIRPLSPQVQALVNSSEPIDVQGDVITLGCVNELVCEKLAEDKRRDIVEKVLAQVLGVPCHIKCVVQASQREMAKDAPARNTPSSNLFSGEDAREKLRQKLLEHPAVKELEKRGGRVAKVSLAETSEEEDDRG